MSDTIAVEIRNRWTNAVIYTAQIPADTPSGLHMRAALEKATTERVDLRGAYLRGAYLGDANLDGANLDGAYLRGAYLRDANLGGANLGGADLRGAYLRDANLGGANLGGADLRGAYLRGAYLRGADGRNLLLIGDRPYLGIGPLGSRHDTLHAFVTDAGVMIRAGCFFGTLDAFRSAIDETHGDCNHGREYRAAIALIEAHAREWAPAAESQEAA